MCCLGLTDGQNSDPRRIPFLLITLRSTPKKPYKLTEQSPFSVLLLLRYMLLLFILTHERLWQIWRSTILIYILYIILFALLR